MNACVLNYTFTFSYFFFLGFSLPVVKLVYKNTDVGKFNSDDCVPVSLFFSCSAFVDVCIN